METTTVDIKLAIFASLTGLVLAITFTFIIYYIFGVKLEKDKNLSLTFLEHLNIFRLLKRD